MSYRNHSNGRYRRGTFPLDWSFPMTRGRRVLGSLIVSMAIASGGHASWEAMKPTELFYKASGHAEAAELSTIDDKKAEVLDTLAKCENPNHIPIVFDTNGVASVGDYQWQPLSFIYYWEKMTGVKLTETEAVIYALDREKARGLASFVIFELGKGVGKDWVNCNKWHDLDTLVRFIKSHE